MATEDKSFIPPFKKIFGNACVMLDREYINYNPASGTLAQQHLDRDNDYFLTGKDYLTQMVMLSKCNSFVTARTSGSIGVMMMSEGFENLYVFNLGRYGVVNPKEFMD